MAAIQLPNTASWSGPRAAGMGQTTIPPIEPGVDSGGLLDTVWRGFNAIGTDKGSNLGPNALGQPKSLASTIAPIIITQPFYAQPTRSTVLFTIPDPNATVVMAGVQGVAASATSPGGIFVPFATIRPGAVGSDFNFFYSAIFGASTVGQRVFISLTPVNQWGVAGPATVTSAIVNSTSSITFVTLTSTSPGTITATWLGGQTFAVALILADGSRFGSTIIAVSPQTTSPFTFTGLVSGTVVGGRMTDGVAWGTGGGGTTVM